MWRGFTHPAAVICGAAVSLGVRIAALLVVAASAFCDGSPYLEADIGGTELAPSASQSSVEVVLNPATTGTVMADAVDSATITVTVRDPVGQPIGNVPIQVEVTGARNFVTPAAATLTDVNGVAILNLTSTKAETKRISLTVRSESEDVQLDDHPVVTFVAGTPIRTEVTASDLTADVGTLTVTARDFFDNVVTTRVLQVEEDRATTIAPEH
jgi:Bacterial Ig-like domain (group 1)